jgi:NNMT/PNMT/TEMT family
LINGPTFAGLPAQAQGLGVGDYERFSPAAYLDEYYSSVAHSEIDGIIKFYSENVGVLQYCDDVIEVGGGPTIYQLISIAPLCGDIVFGDYLAANLDEVRGWASNAPGSFDWSAYIARSLQYENKEYGPEAVKARENIIKEKLTSFVYCDALRSDPIGAQYRHSFGLVSSHYVAESIARSKQDWQCVMDNILSLVKRDGYICMSFITGADRWLLSGEWHPACSLTEDDVATYFRDNGFEILKLGHIPAAVSDPDADDFYGYTGALCLYAKRSVEPAR